MSMNRTTRTKANGGKAKGSRYAMPAPKSVMTTGSSYVMTPGLHGAEALRRIRTPNPTDVLCGRGGSINSHRGNKIFREWVHQRKNDYNLAVSKAEKAHVSREIIDMVRAQNPPGKFLMKDSTAPSGGSAVWWVEIDDLKAMAKTSQALREGAPTIRAQHKEELDEKKQQISRKPAKKATLPPTPAESAGRMPPPMQPPAMTVSMSPDVAVEALRTAAEAAKHGLGQPFEQAGVKRPSPIVAPLLSNARFSHTYERPSKAPRMASEQVDRDMTPTPPLETPPLMPVPGEAPESFMSLSKKSSAMKRSHSLALSDMSAGDIYEDFVNPFEDESDDRNGKRERENSRLAYAQRSSGEDSTNSVGEGSFGSLLKKSSSSDWSRQRSNGNNVFSPGPAFKKNVSSRSVSVDEGTTEETSASKNCFCECGSTLEEGKVCPCGALADHLAWRDDSISGQDWLNISGFYDQIVPVSP